MQSCLATRSICDLSAVRLNTDRRIVGLRSWKSSVSLRIRVQFVPVVTSNPSSRLFATYSSGSGGGAGSVGVEGGGGGSGAGAGAGSVGVEGGGGGGGGEVVVGPPGNGAPGGFFSNCARLIGCLALASFGTYFQLYPEYYFIGRLPGANVALTFLGMLWAWLFMPSLLRISHRNATPLLFVFSEEKVPYQESAWKSLELAIRVMFIFISLSRYAKWRPLTVLEQLVIAEAREVVELFCFSFFAERCHVIFHRRKVGARLLAFFSLDDKQHTSAWANVTSVIIYGWLTVMVASRYGLAKLSVLTAFLGIGGVVTVFVGKQLFENILATRPFSIGDTIKAKSVEGEVVRMGLVNTSLLTEAENFPVTVSNSSLLNEAIVNKSRAQCREFKKKIPLKVDDLVKITKISADIERMLLLKPEVFEGKEGKGAPYCILSGAKELTLACKLKSMSENEWIHVEHEILLQSLQIIKDHGVDLADSEKEKEKEKRKEDDAN